MSKAAITILAIIVLFFGIRYLSEGFFGTQQLSIREFTETAQAPPTYMEDREVSGGGPSSPNAILPARAIPTIIAPPETPKDPFDQTEGRTDSVDTLRYPERSFAPGVPNDVTQIASHSGVANTAAQEVNNSFRIFSPEYAQNGGYIEDQVVANDTLDEHLYSAF